MPPIEIKTRIVVDDFKIPGIGKALAGLDKQIKESIGKVFAQNFGKINLASDILKDLRKIPTTANASSNSLRSLKNNLQLVFGTSAERASKLADILGKARIAIENIGKAGNSSDYKRFRDQLKDLRSQFSDITNPRAAKKIFADLISQETGKNLREIRKALQQATTDANKFNEALNRKKLIKANTILGGLVASGSNIQTGEVNFQETIASETERIRSEALSERKRLDKEGVEFSKRLEQALVEVTKRAIEQKIKAQKQYVRERQRLEEQLNTSEQDRLITSQEDASGLLSGIKQRAKFQKQIEDSVQGTVKDSIRLESLLEKFDKSGGSANSANRQKLVTLLGERNAFIDSNGRAGVGAGGRGPTGAIVEDQRNVARVIRGINEEIGTNIKATNQAGFSIREFGRQAALAFKRYSAFVIGTAVLFRIRAAFSAGLEEAIKFEAQITKVEQVIGGLAKVDLKNISDSIRNVSLSVGTDAIDIAKGVQTLAQAGFTDPKGLQEISKLLGKVPLAATFDGVDQTVEGLIAIFGQFNKELSDTGYILDLVNQFAADFAVESKDIFEIVKRGGATFATAGGSLEELIALSSVLRSSTRESAETIGTFFKTALAQLLSPKSQSELRDLGVTATNVIDQLKQLSVILPQFSQIQQINIAEDLTGQRQFARLTALLREINDPKIRAQVSKSFGNVSGSLDRAAIVRLDDFGQSLNRIKQSFADFGKSFIENESIKSFVKNIADLTQNLALLLRNVEPLIPVFTSLIAILGFKIGKKFFGGFIERLKPALSETIGLLSLKKVQSASGENISFGAQLSSLNPYAKQTATRRGLRNATLRGSGRLLSGVGILAGGALSGSDDPGQQFASGALTGAGIGATIAGPIGALVGGVGGVLVTAFNGASEAAKKVEKQMGELANTIANNTRKSIKQRAGELSSLIDAQEIGLRGRSQGVSGLTLIARNGATSEQQTAIQQAVTKLLQDRINEVVASNSNIKNRGKLEFIVNSQLEFLLQDYFDIPTQNLQQEIIKSLNLNITQIVDQAFEGIKVVDIQSKVTSIINGITFVFKNIKESLDLTTQSLDNILLSPDSIKLIGSNINKKIIESFSNISGDLFGIGAAGSVLDSLNRSNVLKPLIGVGNGEASLENILTTQDRLKQSFDGINAAKLSDIFDTLAGLSNNTSDTGFDILKQFTEFRGTGKDFIDQLLGSDFQGNLADALRSGIDLFNKQIEIQSQLRGSVRTLNDAFADLDKTFKDSIQTGKDRAIESQVFNKRLSSFANNTLRGQSLLGQASTLQFTDTSRFIGSLIGQGGIRNRLAGQVQQINDRSLNGLPVTSSDLDTIRKSATAQQDLLDLQSELGRRIADVNDRLGKASQATDVLRQAFLDFDSSIQSAGEAISSITIEDFAKGLASLNKFNQTGLNGLKDSEFNSLKQVLGIAGDINIGKGTGNEILRQINEQLAIPALASIRSQSTGESLQQAASTIQQQFQDAAAKAEQARQIEENIRNDQQRLISAQIAVNELERQFYTSQQNTLATLSSPLDQINSSLKSFIDTGLESILRKVITANPLPNAPILGTETLDPLNRSIQEFNNILKGFGSFPSIPASLEVSPIQVNVAVSAPDIVQLAGNSLYAAVMQRISPAIAQAFGVVSEEARSVYEGNVPQTLA